VRRPKDIRRKKMSTQRLLWKLVLILALLILMGGTLSCGEEVQTGPRAWKVTQEWLPQEEGIYTLQVVSYDPPDCHGIAWK
jgi:hypothetical protein